MTIEQRLQVVEDEFAVVKELLASAARYAESANRKIDAVAEQQRVNGIVVERLLEERQSDRQRLDDLEQRQDQLTELLQGQEQRLSQLAQLSVVQQQQLAGLENLLAEQQQQMAGQQGMLASQQSMMANLQSMMAAQQQQLAIQQQQAENQRLAFDAAIERLEAIVVRLVDRVERLEEEND